MFFFSILGICVEKTYISMRPWAQWCESNGHANLFMILAVSSFVIFFSCLFLNCFKMHILCLNKSVLHATVLNASAKQFYHVFAKNKSIALVFFFTK